MRRRPITPRRTFVASVAFMTGVVMALSALAGNADTKPIAICVQNTSGDELLFVAEADGGERVLRTLGLGETLCTEAPETGGEGVVGVFENEDSLEGCSRLAVAGKPERLISYVAFDNCTWANP